MRTTGVKCNKSTQKLCISQFLYLISSVTSGLSGSYIVVPDPDPPLIDSYSIYAVNTYGAISKNIENCAFCVGMA